MGRKSALSNITFTDLRKEISRRQRKVGTLMRRRDRLMKKVHALDATIAEYGGRVSGIDGAVSGRRRARNEMSLVEALSKVLTGKTMGVTEVAEAVQKAGYVTTSPSFRTIVNQALIASGKFKRVERGQYTAK